MKLTPVSFAAASRVFANFTKSFEVLHAPAPAMAAGVTDIRLFTMGIAYFFSISLPVFTRSFATVVIFL